MTGPFHAIPTFQTFQQTKIIFLFFFSVLGMKIDFFSLKLKLGIEMLQLGH